MIEYEELKSALAPILIKSGFILKDENIRPDVFGSAYSEFSKKELRYRIVWDGKDGCGYIETMENNNWVSLKATAPENTYEKFTSALAKMSIALREHINSGKLNA